MLNVLILTLQMAAPPNPPRPMLEPIVYHGRLNQTSVTVPKRPDSEIRIDGSLSETEWLQAALLTGFSQFTPVDGLAAEDSTEILVWYTDHAIYLGVRAYEPHGRVNATLADRDRISGDDYVYFLLDTFNDKRRALFISTNPLGVQSDGVMEEGRPLDLSPDYLFQSKGRVTDFGYEMELRIPFKSIRYPSALTQDWGFNVVRRVQHSGQDQTWTAARRGPPFLSQSGLLQQLTDLKRGLVLELNPVATAKLDGVRTESNDPSGNPVIDYKYGAAKPDFSGNVRWGITPNLTMNGTANPDFSQVEADVAQVTFDPRQAISFPEKRPFFLDAIEHFGVPNSLIYTRRIVNPDGALKFTGTVGGTSVGLLSASDAADFSRTGDDHPLYTIVRLRRDVGAQSTVGLVFTDKEDGDDYNRVAGIDARFVFKKVYTLTGQVAGSFWRNPVDRETAPLWEFAFNRNGRRFGWSSTIEGTHDDFVPGAGFVSRRGIVHSFMQPNLTFYGKPGARVQAYNVSLTFDNTWDYQEFEEGIGPDDIKLHWNNNFRLRGGWGIGVNLLFESFRFPAQSYANYRVEVRSANGTVVDTTDTFIGRRRIPNYDLWINFNTPQFPKFSANGFVIVGRDENFEEWAPGYIVILQGSTDYRPTNQIRLNFRYVEQRTIRNTDRSVVRLSRIPRLKLEYQVRRPLFVRVVGQYVADERPALRDDARTGDPILILNPRTNTYSRGAFQNQSFRGDVLLSYTPTPGTVIYVGYGSNALDSGPFDFREVVRTNDGFFVKLSYLLRL